jgi:RNA polymerase sigma factor (sigma-70 family)
MAEPLAVSADTLIDELVPELTPMLWQVARGAGLGTEDAKDVVQTTWVNLFAHLDSIRAPGALTAWLVTATRREAWRVATAGRRTLPADQQWLASIPAPGKSLEDQAVLSEEQQAIWAALRTLSPRCQELLRIVAFVPRPDYDTVATRLGMARGSVGPTRGRCLDKLRRALDAGPESPEESCR